MFIKYIVFISLFILFLIAIELVDAYRIESIGVNVTKLGLSQEYLNVSYVHTIVFMDHLYLNKYCGYYLLGGKVYISVVPECDLNRTIEHEFRHQYWFRKMNIIDRLNYCHSRGMGYNRECWEYYAEQGSWKSVVIN